MSYIFKILAKYFFSFNIAKMGFKSKHFIKNILFGLIPKIGGKTSITNITKDVNLVVGFFPPIFVQV